LAFCEFLTTFWIPIFDFSETTSIGDSIIDLERHVNVFLGIIYTSRVIFPVEFKNRIEKIILALFVFQKPKIGFRIPKS
jgi:hypothetical protein